VSFAAITLCVASQRVFIGVSVYFPYRLTPETFGYSFVYLKSYTEFGSLIPFLFLCFLQSLIHIFVPLRPRFINFRLWLASLFLSVSDSFLSFFLDSFLVCFSFFFYWNERKTGHIMTYFIIKPTFSQKTRQTIENIYWWIWLRCGTYTFSKRSLKM